MTFRWSSCLAAVALAFVTAACGASGRVPVVE
jgi:hypothetical protein